MLLNDGGTRAPTPVPKTRNPSPLQQLKDSAPTQAAPPQMRQGGPLPPAPQQTLRTSSPTSPMFSMPSAQSTTPGYGTLPTTVTPAATPASTPTEPKEFPFGQQVQGPWEAPPTPSPELKRLLNEQNWELPEGTGKKKVGLPKDLFDPDAAQELKDYSYELDPKQWDLIRDTYASAAAATHGYDAPPVVNITERIPLMNVKDNVAAPLTTAGYLGLSGSQKAAVDFNTLLIAAREKDLSQPELERFFGDDEEMAAYDEKVTSLFGATGGSSTYAPNTVDFLSQLDMDFTGQDLDEYLSLERAISSKEMKTIKFSDRDVQTLKGLSGPAAVENPTTEQLAAVRTDANMAALDSALVAATRDLVREKGPTANEKWTLESAFFGSGGAPGSLPELGYGDETTQWPDIGMQKMDQFLRGAYTYLSDPDVNDLTELNAEMNLQGFTPEDRQLFLDYVNNRTTVESRFASTPEGQRKPMQIRALLGLEG